MSKNSVEILYNKSDWDIAFIDWPLIDRVGHTMCTNCPENYEALERTDKLIERFITDLPSNTTLIIFTDHGRGEFRDHGGSSDAETHIFFYAMSKTTKFQAKRKNAKLNTFKQIHTAVILSTILQLPAPTGNIGAVNLDYIMSNDFDKIGQNEQLNLLNSLRTVLLYTDVAYNHPDISNIWSSIKSLNVNISHIADVIDDVLDKIRHDSLNIEQTKSVPAFGNNIYVILLLAFGISIWYPYRTFCNYCYVGWNKIELDLNESENEFEEEIDRNGSRIWRDMSQRF